MRSIDKRYELEYKKFERGTYNLTYKIDNKFFENFEYSEIKKGNIDANLTFSVNGNSIVSHIHFVGTVEVQCDICLEYFDYPIDHEVDLIFKITHELPEEDTVDDIVYIAENSDIIDLTKHFYDYIVLSLPIKKVHPIDENGNRTCKTEYLEKLEELEQSTMRNIPGWDKLKNFFN